ncbi:MAG: TIGR02453 family protein [Methylobacteriaceae bacterium]|nr:TIGR02453 family protein [Methylobacteriaceae bacterium]
MARAAARKRTEDASGFRGFGPRTLDFFRALAFHQSKAWFEENRALYEAEVKAPLEAFVVALSAACAERGLPLRGEPKSSVFRLHRDIRFSKDKRPYKTNGGAVLTRDGTKKAQGLLYIHIDPEGCFAASGFYHPEPGELAALRTAIVARPDAFRETERHLAAAGIPLGREGAVSRTPKGCEGATDPDIVAAVRLTSLVVRRPLSTEEISRPDLVERVADLAADAQPLLRFGWRALDEARGPDGRVMG